MAPVPKERDFHWHDLYSQLVGRRRSFAIAPVVLPFHCKLSFNIGQLARQLSEKQRTAFPFGGGSR